MEWVPDRCPMEWEVHTRGTYDIVQYIYSVYLLCKLSYPAGVAAVCYRGSYRRLLL
jgi:hypothetical protein